MAFGTVMHMDLTIPNADEVRDFYQAVAGWSSMGLSMGDYDDYVMMDAAGNPVAGICHRLGENSNLPPQWLIYITVADVNASGYNGSVNRKSGAPLQGRLSKMNLTNVTVALQRGEIILPLDALAPDSLVAMEQSFCQQISDSTEYYRRQELIAVFAKMEGLDQMAHAVAAQLMEENRAFRQRWTRVEQSGS